METIIVTGASSGIGAAIVARLRRPNRRVFASMRRLDPKGHDVDAISLDVTSDASVQQAVARVLAETGRVDAVINNAGITMYGAVEETTADEALSMFQTNFFGVHRLIQTVLPTMRAQKRGRLVTIGSIAGFLPEPFEAFYSATKHALEGYVESLDYEVQPFGIRSLLIQPGYIHTALGAHQTSVANHIEAYARRRSHVAEMESQNIEKGAPPEAVAAAVERVLAAPNPPRRTLVGADARQLYALRHFLPASLFSMGMRRRLG